MKALLAGLLLACWPVIAAADIFAWEDAQGIMHYTNLKTEVPKADAAAARVVVVDGSPPAPTSSGPPVVAAPAGASEAVSDQPPGSAADVYLAGLERGLEIADPVVARGGGGGSVQISGPLVVNLTPPTALPDYGAFSPYGLPLFPYGFQYGFPYGFPPGFPFLYGYPLVTAFVGGQCRHGACFGGGFGRHREGRGFHSRGTFFGGAGRAHPRGDAGGVMR